MPRTVDGRPKWNARGERRCAACGDWKPRGEFYRSPAATYDCYCVPCRKAYVQACEQARYRSDPAYRAIKYARYKQWYATQKARRADERAWRKRQGPFLVERALAAGTTTHALARVIGATQSNVSGWKTGKHVISQRRLDDLRAAVQRLEAGTT